MQKFKAELKTLRKQLQTADNFSDIMRYFFDHMAESDDFLDLSKRSKNKLLKTTLKMICEQVYGEDVALTHLLILELKAYRFYHGGGLLNGRPLNMIYFADIDMGLVACPNARRPEVIEYARFTCHKVDIDDDAILHPGTRTLN